MASIEDIIRREVNPFDPITFKPGNFWREKQDPGLNVETIHKEAITEIETLLEFVAKDHRSRTVLLTGESGSGKSYLLGRLKRTLNPKAFFAYIGSWADSDHIRRHILRYTVDSLMQFPEGQQESQLMLWLKSLSAFTKRNLKQRIFDDSVWNLLSSNRKNFINHLKKTYKQAGIYNADSFFGVLHDLTDPELDGLACEWLRGDDLSEESLKALNIKHSIQTEEAAWETLSNLGRISTETHPIVLCFDNLDNIPRDTNGFQDLQSLFNVNTTIHNDYLKNFLIIISIITNNWKRNSERVQQADKARIEREVHLKNITLDQAEALWSYRLKPLHHQANPQPSSSTFPLIRQALEIKFPGGKTSPRDVLILGEQLFEKYKKEISINGNAADKGDDETDRGEKILALFKLAWQHEYSKTQSKITKISLLAAPELIRMLEETLTALQVKEIKLKLLSGKFASYSLSYQKSNKRERVGIVWTEDAGMNSFYTVMNACQNAITKNSCQTLYLIRAAMLGSHKLAGNQIYKQIFKGVQHHHIKPSLSSVHHLATYHNLVNAVLANELVVAGQTISRKELEDLIRKSEILKKCTLLQDLEIVQKANEKEDASDLEEVKESLLNIVKTQSYLAKNVLTENTLHKFSQFNQSQIEQMIQELCQNQKIQIINPDALPKDQLVCFVPKS